jgi:hypothetical protein
MKKIKALIVIFIVCILFGTTLFAQHDYFSTIKFNVPFGKAVKNSGGLEVKGTLVSTKKVALPQATLTGEPAKFLKKKLFIFFITVTNTGKNPIEISEWHFQLICSENNQALQWQENSFVNLVTPFISNSENVILLPGEKKSFNTGETDFFWCFPKHEDALMTDPCSFTALIVCKQNGNPVFDNHVPDGFYTYNCIQKNYEVPPVIVAPEIDEAAGSEEPLQNETVFDPELLALIDDFKKAQEEGNTTKSSELKKTVLEIAGHAYPDKLNEINLLLGITPVKPSVSKIEPVKPKVQPVISKVEPVKPKVEPAKSVNTAPSKTPVPDQNTEYSDWGTVKNPYYAMQVRYKLEKKEGDINYYRAQLRVNFDDPSRTQTARCLGYVVCFGIPTIDGLDYNYLHYEIFYTYKQTYTMPDLIPMKMSFPDGSKRMLRKDGFYYTTKDSQQETYFAYFDKSVDLILTGYPITCRNFVESKAIILK